jgi:hypothetical protein
MFWRNVVRSYYNRQPQCSSFALAFGVLQVVLKDNVEEALGDSEYLQLINKLAHPPDMSTGKTLSQHGDSSSSHDIQDSLDVPEANFVSTFMFLCLMPAFMVY